MNGEGDEPFRVLTSRSTLFNSVCFHPSLPLFAAATDRGSLQIVHAKVNDEDEEVKPLIVPVKMLSAPGRIVKVTTELPKSKYGEDVDKFDEDEEDEERKKMKKMWAEQLPEQKSIVPAAQCCVFHPIHPWIFGGFDDGMVRLFV